MHFSVLRRCIPHPPSLIPLCLVAILAGTAGAQDSTGATPADSTLDSLRARLERAEEAIELLRQQMAAQASTEVRTRSRARLEISGRVLVNAFSNSRRVNNVDVPQFVLPDIPIPPGTGTSGTNNRYGSAGLVARQSSFGIAASGIGVAGGEFLADADFDLFGGTQTGAGGRQLFPQPRLRTARVIVRWARGELLAGQDVPLIAPWNPVSVASIGTAGFASAGNLWNWLPQIRGTVEVAGVGVQAAVLAPHSGGETIPGEPDAVDAGERSRRPFVEARLRRRWGADAEARSEVGVSVHRGWLATRDDSLFTSEAFAADFNVRLGARVGLRGEAYRGRLLRGLGGGGIGQNFAFDGPVTRVVPDRGGWLQANVRATGATTVGAGCGVDDPEDVGPAQRLRNLACEGHAIWRGPGGLLLGAEYRRLTTRYSPQAPRSFASDHLNVAVGVEF
ncbi:MAG TPA: hypothetical protein VKA84_23440 [Gemmatimonadaceae bacterium]|nr:hypothetical protein [Gemmatimonadaceae bacterium]